VAEPVDFVPLAEAVDLGKHPVREGAVLRLMAGPSEAQGSSAVESSNSAPPKYFRITHVFEKNAYWMRVGSPEEARDARRPIAIPLRTLKSLLAEAAGAATWGQLRLPDAMTEADAEDADHRAKLDAAWEMIEPLVAAFCDEANLARSRFRQLIQLRAEQLGASQTTLRRLVQRYYYFGGLRIALLPLPRGRKPQYRYTREDGTSADSVRTRPMRRRGRQSALAAKYGENHFLIGEDDVADMLAAVKRLLRSGPTYISDAHEEYLRKDFAKRHPELHKAYTEGEHAEPVSLRQFRYHVNLNLVLNNNLSSNLRLQRDARDKSGSLHSIGPGDLYEIDATLGRVHLVSSTQPHVVLGTPTIYLVIDRWSRFIVAVYISLRAPAWEELRQALLVAFTSRKQRFRRLKVLVDDKTWPRAPIPAALCADRGSDFMSEATRNAVVSNLRIELTPLPPGCPDGKAIIERFIRELKKRMKSSGAKGVYAERPMTREAKIAAKRAAKGAAHSLADMYRLLVQIVVDRNNAAHSQLRKYRELTRAGIAPTPQNAFKWGLANITGHRSPPLTEQDYWRLLLSQDTASAARSGLKYRGRDYVPDGEAAESLLRQLPAKRKSVQIRLDKLDPGEIFVVSAGLPRWAKFVLKETNARNLGTVTLEEEELMEEASNRLWVEAEHDSRRDRVKADRPVPTKRPQGRTGPSSSSPHELTERERRAERDRETSSIKAALRPKGVGSSAISGQQSPARKTERSSVPDGSSDWRKDDERRRMEMVEAIRRKRRPAKE